MKKQYQFLAIKLCLWEEDVIRTSQPIQTGAEGDSGFNKNWANIGGEN